MSRPKLEMIDMTSVSFCSSESAIFTKELETYEEALENVELVRINLLKDNKNVNFLNEQIETIKILQEMLGRKSSTICLIPTDDRPIKVVIEK